MALLKWQEIQRNKNNVLFLKWLNGKGKIHSTSATCFQEPSQGWHLLVWWRNALWEFSTSPSSLHPSAACYLWGGRYKRGVIDIRTITMHFLNTLWNSFSLCASLLFWLSCSLGASLLLKECGCLVCQRAPRRVLVCFSSLRKKLLWTCWYPQSPLDSAISPINTTGVVFETTSWLI